MGVAPQCCAARETHPVPVPIGAPAKTNKRQRRKKRGAGKGRRSSTDGKGVVRRGPRKKAGQPGSPKQRRKGRPRRKKKVGPGAKTEKGVRVDQNRGQADKPNPLLGRPEIKEATDGDDAISVVSNTMSQAASVRQDEALDREIRRKSVAENPLVFSSGKDAKNGSKGGRPAGKEREQEDPPESGTRSNGEAKINDEAKANGGAKTNGEAKTKAGGTRTQSKPNSKGEGSGEANVDGDQAESDDLSDRKLPDKGKHFGGDEFDSGSEPEYDYMVPDSVRVDFEPGVIGFAYTQSMIIDAIQRGGQAEANGVQIGYRLVSLNGEQYNHSAMEFKLKDHSTRGDTRTIVFDTVPFKHAIVEDMLQQNVPVPKPLRKYKKSLRRQKKLSRMALRAMDVDNDGHVHVLETGEKVVLENNLNKIVVSEGERVNRSGDMNLDKALEMLKETYGDDVVV